MSRASRGANAVGRPPAPERVRVQVFDDTGSKRRYLKAFVIYGNPQELLDDIEWLVGSVRPASAAGLAAAELQRMKRPCHYNGTEA